MESMGTFVETDHPREQSGNTGRFRPKDNSAPESALGLVAPTDEEALTTARDWSSAPDGLRSVGQRAGNPWLVEDALARNPNTPADTLVSLAATSLRSDVIHRLAMNPNTPPAVLHRLSDDSRRDIRVYVADNPNTAAEDVLALAGDDDLQVVVRVIARNDLQADAVARLRQSGFLVVHERLDAREAAGAPVSA